MRGTASLALAIAVSCILAGCAAKSTGWYTAGRPKHSRPKAGAGEHGQLGKERTT